MKLKSLMSSLLLLLVTANAHGESMQEFMKKKTPEEKSEAFFNATAALDLKAIELLMSWQAPLEATNGYGYTAFRTLERHHDDDRLTSAIDLFRRYKANIDAANSGGETLLGFLLRTYPKDGSNASNSAVHLLSIGAALPKDAYHYLWYNALRGNYDITKALLTRKVDPNGHKPHEFGLYGLVKGSSIDQKDKILKLLEKYGAEDYLPPPKPEEQGPLFVLDTQFDGASIELGPSGLGEIRLSRYPDSWFDGELLPAIKPGTKAKVKEVRIYKPNGAKVPRLLVETEDGIVGWVGDHEVTCRTAYCSDDHPQRTYPFPGVKSSKAKK